MLRGIRREHAALLAFLELILGNIIEIRLVDAALFVEGKLRHVNELRHQFSSQCRVWYERPEFVVVIGDDVCFAGTLVSRLPQQ